MNMDNAMSLLDDALCAKRWLVCGGRDFMNRAWMDNCLGLTVGSDDILISGGARGADQLAFEWALEHGVFFVVFPADWDQYGKRAGYIRNTRMLDEGQPDHVVAFPGGRGTEMMISIARSAGVFTTVLT